MATIKDIAKKAGVAQGTVSNVLNGKGNVSSDKIRRVMEAARQLGYVPNERAALLRKGTNDCLALIIPGQGSMKIFISVLKTMPRNMVILYPAI